MNRPTPVPRSALSRPSGAGFTRSTARRARRRRLVCLCAAALLAPGCTVGPDYDAPEADAPAEWAAIGAEGVTGSEAPDPAWWSRLADETLETLIERAVAQNLSLEIALARVREARALAGAARGRLAPSLSSAASYNRLRLSENFPVLEDFIETDRIDRDQDLFSAGFDAGWEIDVFGGTRRAVEAAEAAVDVRRAERRDVLLSVVAETARSYFELRSAQRQLATLHAQEDLQRRILELTKDRVAAGLATGIDVAREAAALELLRGAVPERRAAAVAAVMRLAVLTAQDGADLWRRLDQAADLPEPPAIVPVGLPGELLRRRPDVRAAERAAQVASARIGVAVAELYPSFFLTGAAGLQSSDFASLFSAESLAWSIGPSVRWPIFRGGSLRARVDAAEARHARAILAHQRAVQGAIADAEAALTRYAQARITHDRLRDASTAVRESARLAQRAHRNGLSDLEPALRAQRRLAEIEQQTAEARAAVLVALASLSKALGGGWPAEIPPSADATGSEEDAAAPSQVSPRDDS